MKKILLIFAVLALVASCGKNEEGKKPEIDLEEQLIGQWHSTSISVEGDIYIEFYQEKSFELYQQIGEGAYRLYRGTWNLEGDLLTGKYNDGEDWAAAYKVAIEGDVLTMTSQNDAAETSTYKKSDIPSEVKERCETVVKSR
ncbi:MAG: hypothetical protein J6Q37_06860 [Bacteroidales bacterium]|nr:hypothetical protein [Bacteroidales bacterium]